jgi:hypothetical protein
VARLRSTLHRTHGSEERAGETDRPKGRYRALARPLQGRPCGRPPAAALFTAEAAEGSGDRTGLLVEFDNTDTIFTHPTDRRTEDYVTGRFG